MTNISIPLEFIPTHPLGLALIIGADDKIIEMRGQSAPADFGMGNVSRFDAMHQQGADYLVENGDVLFARSGATVGKAFLVRTTTGQACYAGYLIRARPNTDLVAPEFLFSFTQTTAFARWKDATFNIATIQNIGADKYANLSVPLPPILEQRTILGFIESELAPVRATINRFEREIELLREYRTRLIADVVTGKLDVRKAAAHLPEEAPPEFDVLDAPDVLDEAELVDEEAAA